MDPTSFAAPARIRVLVVPASPQSASEFNQRVEVLKRAETVSHQDVCSANKRSEGHFLITPNCTEFISYSFDTISTPVAHNVLFDLEVWRKQLIVLGVHSGDGDLKGCLEQLYEKFPNAVYHALLVFKEGKEEELQNVFYIHESSWTSIETVFPILTADFLSALSEFWNNRQLKSFQSPLELLPDQGDHFSQPHKVHHHRRSSKLGKRAQLSMTTTEYAKLKQDYRSEKYFGTLLMLSGLYKDALVCLGEAVEHLLYNVNDHLWGGAAFNEICVCLAMLRANDMPANIPHVALTAANEAASRQKKANGKNSTIPGQTQLHHHQFTQNVPIEELLEFLVLASLDEFASGQDSELVPYTVYYETITRYAGFLINLRHMNFKDALGGVSDDHASIKSPKMSLLVVDKWISKVGDLSSDLLPDTKAKILASAARLYAACGMERKWAFTCVQIVSLLASTNATVNTDLGVVHDVLQVYATLPKLEAQMLRKLVALGHRIKNPLLQTNAASRLLKLATTNFNEGSTNFEPVEFDIGRNASSTSLASITTNNTQPGLPTGASLVDVGSAEQLTLYYLIRNSDDVVQCVFWDNDIIVDADIRSLRLTTVAPRKNQQQDGIIYNPFDGQETKEETSVEEGVPTRARIWLRNPLAVDIQIFQVGLVDDDGNLVSKVIEDFVVPAYSHNFRVDTTVIPVSNEKSMLEASACLVHVYGCSVATFKLPKPISIPVVPPRPVLALQSLSLLKGCAMMLEGENRKFTIELWNSSQTECRVLHYAYNETPTANTSARLAQFANKREVSKIEMFEHELHLQKRPAIELIDKELKQIAPHESRKFSFSLFGKHGIQGASVLIDYGHTEDRLRRIKIPLQITVHRSIWIDRCTILPREDKVLLVIDLRNGWQKTIHCNIWVAEGKEPELIPIEPTASHRLLLEVPWKAPSLEELMKPIPLMNARMNKSVDRYSTPEQLQRFWLREKLLALLSSKWTLGDREGVIELRKIELTARTADILRGNLLDITSKLEGRSHKMDEPVTMQVCISNNSDQEVQGMLRLAPNRAAQKFMLPMGCSQQLITLGPKEKTDVAFNMVFVSCGNFEVATVFDSPSGCVFQNTKTLVNVV